MDRCGRGLDMIPQRCYVGAAALQSNDSSLMVWFGRSSARSGMSCIRSVSVVAGKKGVEKRLIANGEPRAISPAGYNTRIASHEHGHSQAVLSTYPSGMYPE